MEVVVEDKQLSLAIGKKGQNVRLAAKLGVSTGAYLLGLTPPDVRPRVTQEIASIIALTERLVANGHAYATPSGDVYFRVRADEDYGKLSHRNIAANLSALQARGVAYEATGAPCQVHRTIDGGCVVEVGGALSGLMAAPRLLILDEPSLGLSPLLVEEMFALIGQLNAQGLSILLVEQNALMALQVANRGYVLQTGRIVLQDTAENLGENEMVRKAYLGES